ncbi:hypothetical protein BUALT_Bualt04G0109600 [Buddleja alternifolia]|uniref:Transposase-associated domain-containing protein n=1 Tax=Buddleja alternifolia TaxID=168488 RepID=A0AAV6XMY5_9LAMI|nr:hypothetical protein BUALT_Bualt04G0109600 [Buddleja alternifolia]
MASNRQNATIDELFGNASWDTTAEDSFVRKLKIASTSTNWHNVVDVDRILCRIAQEMSVELRRHVSLNLLREKFKELQNRYITFKRLTVWLGAKNNFSSTRFNITVGNSVERYWHTGERCWSDLQVIFRELATTSPIYEPGGHSTPPVVHVIDVSSSSSVPDESSRNGSTDPWEIARIRSAHQEHSEQGSTLLDSLTTNLGVLAKERVILLYRLINRIMDKSWIDSSETFSAEYISGVAHFLEFAFTGKLSGSRIYCPCTKCKNRFTKKKDDVREHCLLYDFEKRYKNWRYHGEAYVPLHRNETNEHIISDNRDDIVGMVHEAVKIPSTNVDVGFSQTSNNEMNEETKNFFKLLQDAETELLPGCAKQTKLSFVVRLLQLKALCGWTNKSIDLLLELLKDSFPDGVNIPANYYEAQKITNDLGFTYETIDACPNNCMLFRGKDDGLNRCEICNSSRYKDNGKKTAAKRMRYFPLKQRLQKLFMSSKTASLMRWHADERIDDGKFRHPADALAWKDFDIKNPLFASDARNIRMGLTSDGFNPFRMMNVSYSTWSFSQTQHGTSFGLHEHDSLHLSNNSETVPVVSKIPTKKNKVCIKKKGRGPAKLSDKWGSGTKVELTLNEEGQVIGEKEEYNCYSSALGTFSHIGTLLPLHYTSWSYMPEDKLDAIWKDVEDCTTLPLEAKSDVLHQLNNMWRDWKRRLKADYFTPYMNDPDHDFSELPNEQIEIDQWLTLVKYWKQSEIQMHQEGKDTTEFDMFIASRSCGQGADDETTNIIKEFKEGLSKRPEQAQTKEFRKDLYVNAFGEDPHGRVRCMGRGITRNKLRKISSSNAPTTQMRGQIEEFRQLKDVLTHELKEVELLKQDLINQKEEISKEREQVRKEFREELDHMQVSLDFFVSLVDPSALQSALSRVRTYGETIANKVNPLADTCGTQLSTDKDTPSAKQQPRPYPDFPMPHELIYEKNVDAPTQGNKNVPHYVVAGNATEINTFDCRPVEVGSDVILFCSEPKEIVAEGMLLSMDSNEKIDEFALGHEYVKVVIKKAMKPDYFLIRPRRGISTIRQVVGKSVAWEYVNVSVIYAFICS